LEELDQFIQRNGLPLVLKAENSTAGTGVRVCDSLEHARAYWTELKERGNGVAILAQRYIVGVPAMYSFVAMNGNILDGIAALKVTCHPGATGPSATIQVIAHEEIQKTAQAMAKALGLSGYASFDYVVEKETQHAYLIECNPRPTPICHLGGLSGSLLEAVTGGPIAKQSLSLGSKIALFPQEWIRRDAEVNDPDLLKDVPADDPELFAHLDAYRLSCLSANRR
jgi:biotin carboxylase